MQAYSRHPYAKSGLGAAFAVGIAVWLYVSLTRESRPAFSKVRGDAGSDVPHH